jgi:hypothetical protein
LLALLEPLFETVDRHPENSSGAAATFRAASSTQWPRGISTAAFSRGDWPAPAVRVSPPRSPSLLWNEAVADVGQARWEFTAAREFGGRGRAEIARSKEGRDLFSPQVGEINQDVVIDERVKRRPLLPADLTVEPGA